MGIRRRITTSFLLSLIAAFAIVAVSFNIIMNAYIRNQATGQLASAAQSITDDGLMQMGMPLGRPMDEARIPDFMRDVNRVARRGAFVAQVQAVVLDDAFEQAYPEKGEEPDDRNQRLIDAIEAIDPPLEAGEIREISADKRTYYVKLINMDASPGGGNRLLLFIDMTDVRILGDSLNIMLFCIVIFALMLGAAIAFFMSARLAKPIRALSDFAEAIGSGRFEQCAIDVVDRELIELRDTMNRAAEQLGRYDSEQKVFFENASHELRTPLMSMKGYAEGIQVGVFDDNRQAAGIIVAEADRMADMVEDLLYISRIDNITATEKREAIDARELLSDCGESLNGMAIHEGKRILYDFPDEPVMIFGAEKPLTRAFTNLLVNGLRYAVSSVNISIRAADGRALVQISDDGAGIAREDLPRIFDRFYKGRGGNHGIGLSIAKTVINHHNGEITAKSDGGAAFSVILPELPEEGV